MNANIETAIMSLIGNDPLIFILRKGTTWIF